MSDPARPLDAMWQPRALVWAIVLVLGLAVVLALAPGQPGGDLATVIERFGLYAFLGAWIVLLALAGLYGVRNHVVHLPAPAIAWIAVGLLLASTLLVCGASFLVIGGLGDVNQRTLLLRTAGISMTVGLLAMGGFRTVWGNIQLRAAARQAELAALQARVHPHFLFNTLNTAVTLVRQQPAQAETLLHDLSDLFRAALSAQRDIPLAQELHLCERYLEIEKLRLGERLTVRWARPPQLPDLVVPALLIQPLVENAVRHGIESQPVGGEVSIEVECGARALVIRVGNPLPAAPPRRDGHHIGQSAVRGRVALATQEQGKLTTGVSGGRYVATVTLPLV
jgi:two-component system sensor histidine kinase AlgZ